MDSTASRIRVVDHDGVMRIEFIDRNILDEANIQQIGEEIGKIVDSQDQPKVLISFQNVDHLSNGESGGGIDRVARVQLGGVVAARVAGEPVKPDDA